MYTMLNARRGIVVGALVALVSLGVVLPAAASAAAQPSAPAAPSTSAPVRAGADSTTETPKTTPLASGAPSAQSDCPAGDFCVWVNAGYSDGPARFAGNNANWLDFSHSTCQTGTWSDCASSGYNHGNYDAVEVYRDINYGGDSACLPLGWSLSNCAGYVWPGTGDNFNDSISSNYWFSGC
jgi:Peptidase inhibitor family I36